MVLYLSWMRYTCQRDVALGREYLFTCAVDSMTDVVY